MTSFPGQALTRQLDRFFANKVSLYGVDLLDGTPVLDLKPFAAEFDRCNADRFGWFTGKGERRGASKATNDSSP